MYDTWNRTTRNIDRALAVTQPLSRFRPLARLFSGNLRRLYPAQTYQAMLAEDFTPAGIARTRMEMHAVAAAIPQFRAQPPRLPKCPAIVLSAARADRGENASPPPTGSTSAARPAACPTGATKSPTPRT